MKIETDYAVDTFFPSSSFLQVYFEAVANAFDAGAKDISIHIESDGKVQPPGVTITIVDDGAGFTDDRFELFARLQQPKDAHHKGLGRLVFLKYFGRVDVESEYAGSLRTFQFSNEFEGASEVRDHVTGPTRTKLVFRDFAGDRIRSYNHLKPAHVKRALINQFLPLLHRKRSQGVEFRIAITLETEISNEQHEFFDEETLVTPDDLPHFTEAVIDDTTLGMFEKIKMSYFVDKDGGDGSVVTLASVDSRSISINLTRARPLPAGVSAVFLFESAWFDGTSDTERQSLDLPEHLPRGPLFSVLRRAVGSALQDEIPEIQRQNADTREHFERRYPHLVGLFESESVGVIDRDEALAVAQGRFFKQQKEVLESDELDDETYQKSLDVSSRTLAEYILYRDLIIKRLTQVTANDSEECIHNLIVPRYERFQGEDFAEHLYRNNAWLLDDRFMTFRTVLSEGRMKEIIGAITLETDVGGGHGRPDIAMVFSADPAEGEPVDVVVVEVKRRDPDDKEAPYASTQLIKRARLLVEHCPNIQRVWYFGVIEIDDNLAQILTDQRWAPLFSKGRVFYNDYRVGDVPAPTYLLSFDSVIEDAFARNHTFLELLKSEIKRNPPVERVIADVAPTLEKSTVR